MNVLVTGAGGFIGRPLVSLLAGEGHDVTAFVRSARTKVPGASRVVLGDMTDAASLLHAIEGMDAVVHLAAAKSDEPDSRAVNVGGMRDLIDACKRAGAGAIVYVSSASAKIARPGRYGATKKEAEQILMESGMHATILRPSLVYGAAEGAFGALVAAAHAPVIPVFGDGTWVSHPIDVRDVARAIGIALTSPVMRGHAYDVGGPDAISFDDLLRMIRRGLLGLPAPRIVHVPPGIGIALARALRLFMRRPPITESNVLGSTQDIPWDGAAFFKDSGFTPRTLAEGFGDMARAKQGRDALHEARVLYAYLYSRSGFRAVLPEAMRERYAEAVRAVGLAPLHPLLLRMPMLIGPLDAATKLFATKSALRTRLLVASALVETDPSSAPWLYPQERSAPVLLIDVVLLGASAALKIIVGSALAIVPGFLKTYAG